MSKNILFVFTSTDKNLKNEQTGWYLPEAAHPYYVLSPKHNITFAAPKGPNPPVDAPSVEAFKGDDESVRFLADPVVQKKLAEAKKLTEIDDKDYDAIFYPGGHGPMFDIATDEVSIKLAGAFYNSNRITASVCHGPAAFVNVKDTTGEPILKGRRVTAFSNVEEEQVRAVDSIPFSLEDRLREEGGLYEKAAKPWTELVVVDGHLITGQNPASALGVGKAVLKALG